MTTAREPVVVHFEFAKAIPVGGWEHALEAVERQVTPSDSLLIKAYTDDVGGTRYNDRLARQRAEFVLSWLKARGVKNPMEVEARGKCCYVKPNDTDAGRAANRRAEIHFITPKETNK
ncbi:putative lipoprotein YiaD [Burkholderia multivorans]|nr:putative lipoprotein YiaD [Burkholderia multivorans]MDR9091824.1 putative lipoprotein YiaD [Burkholderia multivorans]MDR9119903.1 putative lipoprotein YiaD [Burkholderia multivorans]MDR9157283.1 putative lipoprotein YiaD [Burkholderia multivorans]MDR9166724.1 putative lipoprotein YiaD [Burkholderia multivorans]